MLTVGPIERDVIDSWPIAKAGLPVRVVNCMRHIDAQSIGQLRGKSEAELLSLRSLGRISLQHIRFFFQLCDQVERGTQVFQTLQEVLDIFLDRSEQFVLAARYGLQANSLEATRQAMTLQEIGNHLNRTRERVRQVEDAAKERLASHMGTVCLAPFTALLAEFIDSHGGALAADEFDALQPEIWLAGLNPAAAAMLLGDLGHPHLAVYRGFFSTLPQQVLEGLDQAATASLATRDAPVTVPSLLSDLGEDLPSCGSADASRVMAVVLDHADGVAATIDSRYFAFARGIGPYLEELLAQLDRPAHYRAVTSAFNERVRPRSRKGAGFILEALNACPHVVRAERGFYDLQR